MRIIFLGTPDFAIPSLAALLEAGHEVVAVVTQPDRPSGRRRKMTESPVKAFARERGLPVHSAEDVNDPAFVETLAELEPDLIVVAAFGQKLGPDILNLPRYGCINVHASLLPRHRGAAPVAHAILAGDSETGVTIMEMAESIDTGAILAQQAVPIGPSETAGELEERLAKLGARLLLGTIGKLAGGWSELIPQDEAQATRAPSLRKKDGLIDWSRPADSLDRFVRAMTPWPGAFTFWHRPQKQPLRLVVKDASPDTQRDDGTEAPGTVLSTDDDRLTVQAGEGVLHILRLQPAGKRTMPTGDFLRGHDIGPGSRLGPPQAKG
jgi:methionyl-tRNA formyltransferase